MSLSETRRSGRFDLLNNASLSNPLRGYSFSVLIASNYTSGQPISPKIPQMGVPSFRTGKDSLLPLKSKSTVLDVLYIILTKFGINQVITG